MHQQLSLDDTSCQQHRVSWIASQFPVSFANRLEILRQIKVNGEEKRALSDKICIERKKRSFNRRMMKWCLIEKCFNLRWSENSNLTHSNNVEQLQLQVSVFEYKVPTENNNKNKAKIPNLSPKIGVVETQLEKVARSGLKKRQLTKD